ncbi:hypothetical protein [Gilliamella sp. ESL0250]|uniref:hypothetical protein n=1 Tax=Gilliamella sp. ESL0250 TaxID=2705036 RepID=UPI0015801769|nr:hypothetical protein [Gilliamella sp. ESL0250]NUF49511.1 hypothetical protein [Gilliamella sp. ESL0250]
MLFLKKKGENIVITKTEQIKAAIMKNDYKKAISMLAKIRKLGKYTEDILNADMAYKHRNFCIQIGKDPDILIDKGIIAIKTKYNMI